MESQVMLRNNFKKNNNFEIGLITLFLSIISYLAYLATLAIIKVDTENGLLILTFSWFGIFLAIFIVNSWKKITGSIFTPYTIFMLFFFLFNYGQPFMWAIGIHTPKEIGQTILFPGLGVPSDGDIIKAQSLTLISILMFHLGAVLSFKKNLKLKYNVKLVRKLYKNNDTTIIKTIFISALIIGIVVIPITLYYAYNDLQIASSQGYKSLYYSEFSNNEATVLGLLTRMFFPCLVGLLIGSKFNKKVRISVYIIFFIYLLLHLLAGDRGSWVYKIVILIWLSHKCYKPINFKALFKYLITSFVGLYITDAIVSMRHIGLANLSVSDFINAFSFKNSIIISTFFEMGGSMKTTIVLQKFGWDIWPYANTYLLALMGMITNNVIYAFDIPFSLISSWFSQDYLGISWGAGFSIVAEALLNSGPFFAPFIMLILGYIISSLIYIDTKYNYLNKPLRFLFVASTLHALLPVSRNYFHLLLKDWFYGVIPFFIVIFIIWNLPIKHQKRNYK
ncbi:O-antigen polysaccharide polymerase Wzy [Halobacillus sp. H74]|uniref:O-antigen polysaccharide polymerase Wzy n=1 Tax=Halobacillus sp. H74 TaxID=3457436 RepID=UPI003FCD3D53